MKNVEPSVVQRLIAKEQHQGRGRDFVRKLRSSTISYACDSAQAAPVAGHRISHRLHGSEVGGLNAQLTVGVRRQEIDHRIEGWHSRMRRSGRAPNRVE
jgi:hypothetical protein